MSNYNSSKNKIYKIWNKGEEQETNISNLQDKEERIDKVRKNKILDTTKKIYVKDSGWINPIIIYSLWEDFSPEGEVSITSIPVFHPPNEYYDTKTFEIQKRQFWAGNASTAKSFYVWNPSASSSLSITDKAKSNSIANADASTDMHDKNPMYTCWAQATVDLAASMGITSLPTIKIIGDYTYHLFVKAQCRAIVNLSTTYITGDTQWTKLGPPLVLPPFDSVASFNAWDYYIPTNYCNGISEINLRIWVEGSGTPLIFSYGTYLNMSPTGIPTNLNDFDLDLALFTGGNISGFQISNNCYADSNNDMVKKGDPVQGGPPYYDWFGPWAYIGWVALATASFTLDNINFYYKKI